MQKTTKTVKVLFIVLLCTIFFTSQLFSQNNYERRISISEWIEEMEKCNNETYTLTNTEIYFDNRKDSLYSYKHSRTIPPSDKDKKAEKNIRCRVRIFNCKLPDNNTSQLRNVIFNNHISFMGCKGAIQYIFYNCTFKQGIDIHLSQFRILEFRYCSILQRTVLNELDISILTFKNCSFFTDHKIVKGTHFFGYEKENQAYQYLFNINQYEKSIKSFQLSHCKILPTEVNPVISFRGGKYDVIFFDNMNFSNSIVDFTNCSVKENFTVRNCKFNQPFGMNRFNFPKDNTSFYWNQLNSVGLALYGKYEQAPFTYKTDSLISNIYNYNELTSSYRKFYSMYRTIGDIESANACYKQMKDMQTMKYQHLHKNDKNLHTWFNWRFNQFLKHFSEYGTNPVQSLIFSMWTILFFAAVYFFFYSNWDRINRIFLIKKHRTLMQYFSSEQKLEDFYTENYIEDLKTFDEYKNEMKESRVYLPLFIVLLGKPLYLFSVIKYKVVSFIYRRTELLHGRWIDLKPARKVMLSITVFIFVIIYLTFLCIIRALNATTLSINAFSTLGFGTIPVKGASRYITILEGFLGWFLLSIFSVSLISQMIQN